MGYLPVTTNSVTVTANTNWSVTSGSFFAEGIWTTCVYSGGIAYGLFNTSNSGGTMEIRYAYIDVTDNSSQANINTLIIETPSGSGADASYANQRPYFVGHDGKAYYGYRASFSTSGPSYSGIWTIFEISPSGSRNVFTHTTMAGGTQPGGGSGTIAMAGNDCGIIIFNFYDHDMSQNIELYFQRDKMYGFSEVLTGGTFGPDYRDSWYSSMRDEIGVVNGSTLKTWKLPTPVDGMFTTTVSADAATGLKLIYISGLSSLTSGRRYYLKDSYSSAGDMATYGTIPIGKALSATEILQET